MDARLGNVDESGVPRVEWVARDVSEAPREVTSKLWSKKVVGREFRLLVENPLALNDIGHVEVAESTPVISRLCLRHAVVDGFQALISQCISAASVASVALGVGVVAIRLFAWEQTLENSDTEVILVQLAATGCNCVAQIATVGVTKVVHLRTHHMSARTRDMSEVSKDPTPRVIWHFAHAAA